MDAENFEICAQMKKLEKWVNWGKNRESWITFFAVGGEKIIASQIFYFPKTYPLLVRSFLRENERLLRVGHRVKKSVNGKPNRRTARPETL